MSETSPTRKAQPDGPEAIFDVARGFMAAKALMTASEVGLFAALTEPATVEELAARIGLTPRAVRLLANAMVATGFLELSSGLYHNSAVAETWLSGRSPFDLRPMMRFMNHITYPHWGRLGEAVRTGEPTFRANEYKGESRELYSQGMAAITAGMAQALTTAYDFSHHRRILDVGGGMGTFAAAILRSSPQLEATVLDLPDVAELAQRELSAELRIRVVGGNALIDPLPTGHDAILVANLAHQFSPEQNQILLRRIHANAPEQARLLLVDFWTDKTGTEPAFAALSGLQFLISSEGGGVYSVEEVQSWLTATGWRFVEHRPMVGATGLVVAEVL